MRRDDRGGANAVRRKRLRHGCGRRYAPSCATAPALPARAPTNWPASSLALLSRPVRPEQKSHVVLGLRGFSRWTGGRIRIQLSAIGFQQEQRAPQRAARMFLFCVVKANDRWRHDPKRRAVGSVVPTLSHRTRKSGAPSTVVVRREGKIEHEPAPFVASAPQPASSPAQPLMPKAVGYL
jgi:hypothetical protein